MLSKHLPMSRSLFCVKAAFAFQLLLPWQHINHFHRRLLKLGSWSKSNSQRLEVWRIGSEWRCGCLFFFLFNHVLGQNGFIFAFSLFFFFKSNCHVRIHRNRKAWLMRWYTGNVTVWSQCSWWPHCLGHGPLLPFHFGFGLDKICGLFCLVFWDDI